MDAQTVGIVIALIGVLKGKDLWDYLKARSDNENKGQDKVIGIYEKRIQELEAELKELKEAQEKLMHRMHIKMMKTRGAKGAAKTKEANPQ
jgi:hypothetical protein